MFADLRANGVLLPVAAVLDANQSRRLLSLAAVREGKDREEAAEVGGRTGKPFAIGFTVSIPTGRTGYSIIGRRLDRRG